MYVTLRLAVSHWIWDVSECENRRLRGREGGQTAEEEEAGKHVDSFVAIAILKMLACLDRQKWDAGCESG